VSRRNNGYIKLLLTRNLNINRSFGSKNNTALKSTKVLCIFFLLHVLLYMVKAPCSNNLSQVTFDDRTVDCIQLHLTSIPHPGPSPGFHLGQRVDKIRIDSMELIPAFHWGIFLSAVHSFGIFGGDLIAHHCRSIEEKEGGLSRLRPVHTLVQFDFDLWEWQTTSRRLARPVPWLVATGE